MKSLRIKVMAWVMVLSVCSVLVAVIFAGKKAGETAKKEALDSMKKQSETLVTSLDGFFARKSFILDSVSARACEKENVEAIEIQNYMYELLCKDSTVNKIYLVRPDGKAIISEETISLEESELINESWYNQALKSGSMVVGTPLYNSDEKTVQVMISKPFYKNAEVVGVVAMKVNLVDMVNTLEEIVDNKGGSYFFVADSKGNIVNHPNKSYDLLSGKKANTGWAIDGNYEIAAWNMAEINDYNEAQVYVMNFTSKLTGWKVYYVKPSAVINEASAKIRHNIGILIVTAAVVLCIFAFVLVRSALKPEREPKGEITPIKRADENSTNKMKVIS